MQRYNMMRDQTWFGWRFHLGEPLAHIQRPSTKFWAYYAQFFQGHSQDCRAKILLWLRGL